MTPTAQLKPASGPAERAARRRARRLDEIVAVATDLLAERGYYKMNLDDLAERLDVSKSLLYHYFGGKETLVIACLERIADETSGRLCEVAHAPVSAVTRLEALIDLQLQIATCDFPAEVRLFTQPLPWPASVGAAIHGMRAAHDRVFSGVIDEGLASGEFVVTDAALARQCLYGALNRLTSPTLPARCPSPADLVAVRDTVMRMFLADRRRRSR
jgi:AcrR family transcriptional regulator